jgi:DnaJ domain
MLCSVSPLLVRSLFVDNCFVCSKSSPSPIVIVSKCAFVQVIKSLLPFFSHHLYIAAVPSPHHLLLGQEVALASKQHKTSANFEQLRQISGSRETQAHTSIISAEFVDFYSLLGVCSTATRGEIVAAYHRAALRHHPDKHPSENFVEANAAFVPYAEAKNVLTQPVSRYDYDLRYWRHIHEQQLWTKEPKTAPERPPHQPNQKYGPDVFNEFDAQVQHYDPDDYVSDDDLPSPNWCYNPQPPSSYGQFFIPKSVRRKARAAEMRRKEREARAAAGEEAPSSTPPLARAEKQPAEDEKKEH